MKNNQKNGVSVMEILFILGLLVLWIALQAWVLPRFGVST
jgi:hypothetical protein